MSDEPVRQAPSATGALPVSVQGRPDISICIVNWNGREVLRNCLLSLRTGNEPLHLAVIVVDNASTDGSVQMMQSDFPDVALICNTANRGFAGGNNQGAAQATGRYLLFLNNDTVVQPASLTQLVQFLDAHADVVAAGPKLIGSDGKPQRSGRNLPTLRAMLHAGVLPVRWIRIFARRYRTYRDAFDPNVSGPVPQLAAAALLVRPVPFTAAGGWDEAFEFGVEDVDLCVRLAKVGKIHYLSEAWITHLGRVSSHLDRGRVFRSYQCGHVRYFRKHHRSRVAPLIYKIAITLDTPIRLLILLCKAALSGLTGRREEAARSRQRAGGVWFFVCHGMVRFWMS